MIEILLRILLLLWVVAFAAFIGIVISEKLKTIIERRRKLPPADE